MCTYDKMEYLEQYLNPTDFRLLIDEYHILLKAYSYRQKAVDGVLDCFRKYKSFCFMSATPISADFTPSILSDVELVEAKWDNTDTLIVKLDQTNHPYVKAANYIPMRAWTLSWRSAMPIRRALRANSLVAWPCSMPARTALFPTDASSPREKCPPLWVPARFPFSPSSLPNCWRVSARPCASCSAVCAPRPNIYHKGIGYFWLVKRLTCQNKPVPFWSVAVGGRIGNAR